MAQCFQDAVQGAIHKIGSVRSSEPTLKAAGGRSIIERGAGGRCRRAKPTATH